MNHNKEIIEISDLVLQLQDSGWGDVFMNTSGHVKQVNVYGYKGGYNNFEPTFNINAYYGDNEYLNTKGQSLPEIQNFICELMMEE